MCSLPEREPLAPGSRGVGLDGSLLPSPAARGLGISEDAREPPSTTTVQQPESSLTPLLWQPPCTGVSSSLPRCQPAADLWRGGGGGGGRSATPTPSLSFFAVPRRKAKTALPAWGMHARHCPPTSRSTAVFLQPPVLGSGSSSPPGTCRGR